MIKKIAAKTLMIDREGALATYLTLIFATWLYPLLKALLVATLARKLVPASCRAGCQYTRITRILHGNKTRQGYARKRILKPAGYFFLPPDSSPKCFSGGAR